MNKEKNFVSAVVYVYNAEKTLSTFLNKLIAILENNFEQSEIICVNDDSTDDSLYILQKLSTEVTNTMITVINMSHYHGVERAMHAGVDMSIGDFVYEFDSTNLDYQIEEVMNVYHISLKGYDIVSASPNTKQKISSTLFYTVFNKLSSENVEINTERFRMLSRRAINRIDTINKTIPYRKAVYMNCGLTTFNQKYESIDVEHFISDKREQTYRFDLAIDSLILFTNAGYRVSLFLTLMMMVIALAMALYCVIVYISSEPIAGWTTTILFLSIAFLGLFTILTIVIKYLQVLVDLVFKKKQYSFKSIEKLTN